MNSQTQPIPSRNLVIYFQVHQPRRLRPFQFFDIGSGADYFYDDLNEKILQRISVECYLRTNRLLLNLIEGHPEIKITFSISGTTIDQFEEFAPEVLLSFRDLALTGSVEFLGETYYHSLACMIRGDEFETQILKHSRKVKEHFGIYPSVFRNTELIYNDDIGSRINALGFKGIISDGIERILCKRSPHHIFCHPDHEDFKILLRNYRLSDDIAFRFSHGLTVEQYMEWLNAVPPDEKLVTIALDYETFGEHQKKETGIHTFLEDILYRLVSQNNYSMLTPSEAIELIDPHSQLSVPQYISWADRERDLSAWLGNDMQRDAFSCLIKLEKSLRKIQGDEMLHIWRQLQTSDHFYYMSTKTDDDGNIHSYFSPFCSPYEAFINYMNILSDFTIQAQKRATSSLKKKKARGGLLSKSLI